MTRINELIYDDGMDQEYLQALLDRAEPIVQNGKEYCCVKSQEGFCNKLRCGKYDLVVVTAKEDNGKKAYRLLMKLHLLCREFGFS